MIRKTKAIVVTLVAALLGLSATVAVLAASGDDGDMNGRMDGNQGMMSTTESMDSDAMMVYMRDVLGEEAYQRMLDHFADQQYGAMMPDDPGAGQMMGSMMDGTMQDGGGIMSPGSPHHHELPQS